MPDEVADQILGELKDEGWPRPIERRLRREIEDEEWRRTVAEKNETKERECKTCGTKITGTAADLRKHADTHGAKS